MITLPNTAPVRLTRKPVSFSNNEKLVRVARKIWVAFFFDSIETSFPILLFNEGQRKGERGPKSIMI